MSDTVLMPQLGETVAEGKILAWFKSIGDEIKEGDNLFEVETDKVTIEVQAIVSGRLNEIRVLPGDVAKVGVIVAVLRFSEFGARNDGDTGAFAPKQQRRLLADPLRAARYERYFAL
jgi:pyruvate/2-oxoglutarate dehydrogenase complex dihydrolipoamide acyltransferase (E2) component